ncbi:MAG: hypothetical protein KKF30_07595 [Proteobacteria bacterium]|nr:hypothetical protein [Pseudomonadota bacterium]MBU4470268.1 hypothetical protein [Pseudomonadota bacterium]MCG2752682.1 hypothetical protein [Desulfobacteraceae bacterium]
MVNKKYEEARNKLIPAAEKFANLKIKRHECKNSEDYAKEWSTHFTRKMDELAEKAGLVEYISKDKQIKILHEAYKLALSAAAGFSNYCEDYCEGSPSVMEHEKQLEEAEKVYATATKGR